MTDPISDMLIRIKNAQQAGRPNLEIPFSKVKFELAKIFEKGKFVTAVEEKGKKVNRKIYINLKYTEREPAIQEIIRKSRPSRRVYVTKNEIRPVRQGFGLVVISTSRGLMTGKEAKKAGLGGEVICEIY